MVPTFANELASVFLQMPEQIAPLHASAETGTSSDTASCGKNGRWMGSSEISVQLTLAVEPGRRHEARYGVAKIQSISTNALLNISR